MADRGAAGATAALGAARQTLTADQYQAIHGFLEQHAGIRLGSGKEYLVVSRLTRLLAQLKIADFAELTRRLQSISERRLQLAVIDAMTTNETFWFRDPVHYDILTAGLSAGRATPLRIWCAAASTGQEPYSIMMALRGGLNGRPNASLAGRHTVLGTDISQTALEQARQARYCGLSAARGLNDQQRHRYFKRDGDCLEVQPEFRTGVSFRELNLTRPFDGLGRFDVVFCRNVLIYFSAERKRDIIERIAKVLTPKGHLFLGSTESMNAHADLFEMQHRNGGLVYQRR